MSQMFFKSGEFASLCGTTKDTLRHYEKIGLLKPEKTGENGYKYYSARQFLIFDIISALKSIGTSLPDIKSYIASQSTAGFLSLLKERRAALEFERQRLNRMWDILSDAISTTEQAVQLENDSSSFEGCFFEDCPEEYLICMESELTAQGDQYLMSIRDHIEYCRSIGYGYEIPIGGIVFKESMENGIFAESLYFSKADKEIPSERLFIKPAGRYAVFYRKGSYGDLPEIYRGIYEYLKSRSVVLKGHFYEEDLLNFLNTPDDERYLFKICAEIF